MYSLIESRVQEMTIIRSLEGLLGHMDLGAEKEIKIAN